MVVRIKDYWECFNAAGEALRPAFEKAYAEKPYDRKPEQRDMRNQSICTHCGAKLVDNELVDQGDIQRQPRDVPDNRSGTGIPSSPAHHAHTSPIPD